MDIYKEACQQRLRIQTHKGELSVEQLFDLSVANLDGLAVDLEEEYNNSKGKSFITKRTIKDKTLKLKFDLVLDILNTKVDEADKLKTSKEKKEHNEKIINLIAQKQDGELANKSIKQLEAMLK